MTRKGYIALSAVLIITAFVLVIGSAIGLISFLDRSSISLSYRKEISRALAESCVQKALLKTVLDPAYTGGEDFVVSTSTGDIDSCTIISVASSGTQRTIRTRAVFQGSYSNIQATADVSSTMSIIDWKELPAN